MDISYIIYSLWITLLKGTDEHARAMHLKSKRIPKQKWRTYFERNQHIINQFMAYSH